MKAVSPAGLMPDIFLMPGPSSFRCTRSASLRSSRSSGKPPRRTIMLEVDMASNRSASSCFLKVPSLEACSEEEGLWPQELWVEG